MTRLPEMVPDNFTSMPSIVTNGTTKRCSLTKTEEWIPTYVLLISVLGIVGNVFVLIVFCFHKKACTVAEIYLSNLAAADLVLVSFLPFWAVNAKLKYNWIFGKAMCRLVNAGLKMNSFCSIYLLVLVGMDRYLALVHPLSHSRLRRPKCAKLNCVVVWGFGLLMSLPIFIYRDLKPLNGNITVCYNNYNNKHFKILYEFILPLTFTFIIPVPIISYCTVKIVQALKKRSNEMLNIQKMEHKATTLVLVVLVVFLICWMPYDLIKILNLLKTLKVLDGCTFRKNLDICTQLFTYFSYFNSVLNPILYVIVGGNFRKKVRELFKQWTGKRTLSFSRTGNSLTTQQSHMKVSLRQVSGKGLLRKQSHSDKSQDDLQDQER